LITSKPYVLLYQLTVHRIISYLLTIPDDAPVATSVFTVVMFINDIQYDLKEMMWIELFLQKTSYEENPEGLLSKC